MMENQRIYNEKIKLEEKMAQNTLVKYNNILKMNFYLNCLNMIIRK